MAYGYRERDSQRAKVYRAEGKAGIKSKRFETVPEVEAYLKRCFSHKWFHNHYPEATKFRVRDGRRRRRAGGRGYTILGGGRCILTMPKWSRYELVILHELAHGLTDLARGYSRGYDSGEAGWAPHGWQFCEIYLDIVRHFMGAAAGEKLRRSFREHRVRYYPPKKGRKMTPEQREAACERLADARAKKNGTPRESEPPDHGFPGWADTFDKRPMTFEEWCAATGTTTDDMAAAQEWAEAEEWENEIARERKKEDTE